MSNITHLRACNPPGRAGRRVRALGSIIGVMAAALLFSAGTFASAAENQSRTSQEQHACSVVLGLDPTEDRFDICVRSLERSFSEWDQERLVAGYRNGCAEHGLEPGTPAFAVCVVTAGQTH